MNIIKMNINELKHPEKNPRRHSPKQIKEMVRSLKEFEQYRPIIVDENNTILCGNGLVMALKEMGMEEADVLKKENLTETQKKKLLLADNQLASLGTDDMSIVEQIIQELGDDLEVPGYDRETLEMLVAESEAVTEEVLSYGTFTPQEVEEVRVQAEKPMAPVEQTYQAPVQRVAVTEEQKVEEERTFAETTREQYTICPHCGEKIWLE